MLNRCGRAVIRWRFPLLAFWVIATAIVLFTAPSLADVADYSSQGFLPRQSPSKRAEQLVNEISAQRMGQSSLIITVSRDSGLSQADEAAGLVLANSLDSQKDSWGLQSLVHPWMGPEYHQQLVSSNGHTAMIVLGMHDTAYAHSMPATVESIRHYLSKDPTAFPAGLQLHVTGEGAFSTDEHLMVKQSMDWIAAITVILVLLVLLAIFRSPVAPLLPLSVIGLSFLISRGLIGYLNMLGLNVSAYTETFLIAVLFGAGTDYCLLMVSRFREELAAGRDSQEALQLAQRWSTEAILSSGGATIVGFLCMGFAVFGLYNSIGPSVALGVAVTLLMVLTMTPALISLLGKNVFWSFRHKTEPRHPSNARWVRIARVLTRHPGLILLVTLAFFLPTVIASFYMERSFDQVSELPATADSRQGFAAMERDFGTGALMPLHIVINGDKDMWGLRSLPIIDSLAEKLQKLPDVASIRTATRPTGIRVDRLLPDANVAPDTPLRLPKLVIAANPQLKQAMETFIAPDGRSVYLEVTLASSPYTERSIDMVEKLQDTVRSELKGGWLDGAEVAMGGATAMFADVRRVTAADFTLVMILVLAGVFVVLVLLLRSLVAPLYLLLTIVLSFVSTMGLSHLFFHVILGYEGVNWAVQFFAFCVLVALGVDYNIFLMSRVKEEYIPGQMKETVRRSVAGTGKIITSCGIIMAGCFSAMMISPMRSIQEVGFATVVGMLIDTFIIRSLMVPTLAVLVGEANWWPWKRKATPKPSTQR